jgi:DNA modification methylase
MGKEADGVANDNLYREELDRFQMEWWATFRTFLDDNASAYIWGNAPDLWRLWWLRLADTEPLSMRCQIVWDKGATPGMSSSDMTTFAVATEYAIFFMLADPNFKHNTNSDRYFEGWEPLRLLLSGELMRCGWKNQDANRITGTQMSAHWFTRSQFCPIPREHYEALKTAAKGVGFNQPWAEVESLAAKCKVEADRWREDEKAKHMAARPYFDNAHEIMRDVWEFPRVYGEDRHGHATPKPVAMMEMAIKSSCPPGGLVVEPFGGSGATLMGAEKTGRACYTMEMQARYVDVIVRRWQDFTGKKATLESDGRTFEEVAGEREAVA